MKKLLVLLMAIALVGAFTIPAAAELTAYGNARFGTFSVTNEPADEDADDDTDTEWELYPLSSRFGLKLASGDITGLWEMRPASTSDTRQFYGAWNFGSGELLVGQTWSPISTFASNQVYDNDTGLGSWGDNSYRVPMIQLKFGGLKVAFVQPGTAGAVYDLDELAGPGNTVTTIGGDIDTSLPKIEASYTFSTDMFSVMPYAGYQSYDIDLGDNDVGIDSTIYGLFGKVNFGPAFVMVNVYMTQNFNNYGGWDEVGFNNAVYSIADNKVYDADSFGYTIAVGGKINDMVAVEAGYGSIKADGTIDDVDWEDTSKAYYIQVPITLADGVMLIPEYGKLDYDSFEVDDESFDENNITYIGAKWQINF